MSRSPGRDGIETSVEAVWARPVQRDLAAAVSHGETTISGPILARTELPLAVSPPSARDRRLTELFGVDYLSSDGGESEAPGTSNVTSAQIAGRATTALCSKL